MFAQTTEYSVCQRLFIIRFFKNAAIYQFFRDKPDYIMDIARHPLVYLTFQSLWDKSLETGDERIDTQHKQLIETLNKLIIAHREKRGAAALTSTLDFMQDYVLQHFNDEEMLQLRYRYPKYEEHKEKHNDFKFVVKDLVMQMEAQGYTDALVEKTIKTIADWLITHITGDDLNLAIYIQQKESGKEK